MFEAAIIIIVMTAVLVVEYLFYRRWVRKYEECRRREQERADDLQKHVDYLHSKKYADARYEIWKGRL